MQWTENYHCFLLISDTCNIQAPSRCVQGKYFYGPELNNMGLNDGDNEFKENYFYALVAKPDPLFHFF